MLDELVIDFAIFIQNLVCVGRFMIEKDQGQRPGIVVILKVDDQKIDRFIFVTRRQHIVQLLRCRSGKICKGKIPFNQLLQPLLQGAGRIKDACLLTGILHQSVYAFIYVFIDDITGKIQFFLRKNTHIRIKIQNMEYRIMNHHGLNVLPFLLMELTS